MIQFLQFVKWSGIWDLVAERRPTDSAILFCFLLTCKKTNHLNDQDFSQLKLTPENTCISYTTNYIIAKLLENHTQKSLQKCQSNYKIAQERHTIEIILHCSPKIAYILGSILPKHQSLYTSIDCMIQDLYTSGCL